MAPARGRIVRDLVIALVVMKAHWNCRSQQWTAATRIDVGSPETYEEDLRCGETGLEGGCRHEMTVQRRRLGCKDAETNRPTMARWPGMRRSVKVELWSV
ncbi:hypothetical protein NL676_008111 [Syzygium grande]|nr:hypothetical protein NL676_008111 [Syzygium grande]